MQVSHSDRVNYMLSVEHKSTIVQISTNQWFRK
jgi:hypothetical protein